MVLRAVRRFAGYPGSLLASHCRFRCDGTLPPPISRSTRSSYATVAAAFSHIGCVGAGELKKQTREARSASKRSTLRTSSPSAIQTARRDAPVICAGCGRHVARRMRNQRYCSKRCRQRANYSEKVKRGDFSARRIGGTALPTTPPKNARKFSALQRAKLQSSSGIIAQARVLDAEIFDRDWELVVSTGGVRLQVSRLRRRALVSR